MQLIALLLFEVSIYIELSSPRYEEYISRFSDNLHIF